MKLLVYLCYSGFYRPNGMESPLHIMRMRQRPAANPFKHIPSMYGKCRVIELHFCFDPFYRQQIQLEAENANSTRIENYVQIAIFAKSNAQNGETNTRLTLNSMIQSWRRRIFFLLLPSCERNLLCLSMFFQMQNNTSSIASKQIVITAAARIS